MRLPVAKSVNRRLARLTNAFLRNSQNHEATFAWYVCCYNSCRPHMTLTTTPAVATDLAKEAWSLERLLRESAKTMVP